MNENLEEDVVLLIDYSLVGVNIDIGDAQTGAAIFNKMAGSGWSAGEMEGAFYRKNV